MSDLLAAFDDATAKVSAGFWIDHGGNMLLFHQVKEEFLAPLGLLPARKTSAVSDYFTETSPGPGANEAHHSYISKMLGKGKLTLTQVSIKHTFPS